MLQSANSGSSQPSTGRTSVVVTGVAFTALLVVLCVLSGIWLYYAWHAVEDEVHHDMANLARVAASSADQFLQHYEHSLPMLAQDLTPPWIRGDISEVSTRLRRYKDSDGNVSAVYLFSAEGQLRASSESAVIPPASQHMQDGVFRQDFLKALSQSPMVVGRTRFGKMINDWIIPLRLRGNAQGQGTPFVLSAVIAMQGAHGLWTGIAPMDSAQVGLFRADGFLQYQRPFPSDPEAAFGVERRDAFGRMLRDPQRAPLRRATVTLDEDDYAYQRLERGDGLTAYVRLPRAVIRAAWIDRVDVSVTLILVSCATLLLAAYWAMRQQRHREAERTAAEAQLIDSQRSLERQTQLLQQAQQAARIGGWEFDASSRSFFWTEQTYRIHAMDSATFVPTLANVLSLYAPEGREKLSGAIEQALVTGESWDVEVERATEEESWMRCTGHGAFENGVVSKLWGAFQDVTERRASEQRIRYLAHYDALTGLANRNLFIAHLHLALERAARESRRLAVVFIDLDRFKIINDAMGHHVGDKVLKLMAERLASVVRAADLLARWGGDEFILASEDLTYADDSTALARRLLSVTEQPILIEEGEYVLSASIGIATFPNDGGDSATLIKHADIAMYRAKDQGKNRYEYFSEKLSEASVRRLALDTQLKRAVAEGNQFLLGYQPKVRLSDHQLCGFEALLRWRHPERGIVLPGEFIPLAEESGIVERIGRWVLREACQQAARWSHAGLGRHGVAINCSAREFYGPRFVDDIRGALRESGLHPGQLEVEITETVMMRNVEQVAEVFRELKNLGVRLTLDDFGTGYSSLTYMKRFPLDAVKIDRTFVRDLPDDVDDLAIARAVIAMAHSLRLKVVAEGVETASQMEHLTRLGCDEVQGTYLSPPLMGEELLRFLSQSSFQFQRDSGTTPASIKMAN